MTKISGTSRNCGHCGSSGAPGASVLAAISNSTASPATLSRSIMPGLRVSSPHSRSETSHAGVGMGLLSAHGPRIPTSWAAARTAQRVQPESEATTGIEPV